MNEGGEVYLKITVECPYAVHYRKFGLIRCSYKGEALRNALPDLFPENLFVPCCLACGNKPSNPAHGVYGYASAGCTDSQVGDALPRCMARAGFFYSWFNYHLSDNFDKWCVNPDDLRRRSGSNSGSGLLLGATSMNCLDPIIAGIMKESLFGCPCTTAESQPHLNISMNTEQPGGIIASVNCKNMILNTKGERLLCRIECPQGRRDCCLTCDEVDCPDKSIKACNIKKKSTSSVRGAATPANDISDIFKEAFSSLGHSSTRVFSSLNDVSAGRIPQSIYGCNLSYTVLDVLLDSYVEDLWHLSLDIAGRPLVDDPEWFGKAPTAVKRILLDHIWTSVPGILSITTICDNLYWFKPVWDPKPLYRALHIEEGEPKTRDKQVLVDI